MNIIDETNIEIFRLIQEKLNSFKKILFTIEDGSPGGIKSKDIKISFDESMDSNDKCYQIVLYNTEIKDLLKNIYKKNITTIKINFSSCALDLYQIDIFPKFIKKIILQFKFNCEILKNLPEELEHLHIYDNIKEIKTELNNLPNKLKILEMSYINYNLPLDNLPNNLEKLTLYFSSRYDYDFDNLPSSLNYLEIIFNYNINNKIRVFNNLPQKIEHLKFNNRDGIIINKYPSDLKILELYSINRPTNIPKNIKYTYTIDL